MSEQQKRNIEGVLALIAGFVAVVTLTYTISMAGLPARMATVERQVQELREGRVETTTKLDLLIKGVDELKLALKEHETRAAK